LDPAPTPKTQTPKGRLLYRWSRLAGTSLPPTPPTSVHDFPLTSQRLWQAAGGELRMGVEEEEADSTAKTACANLGAVEDELQTFLRKMYRNSVRCVQPSLGDSEHSIYSAN